MSTFDVDTFAASLKDAMSRATHRREAARLHLEATIRELGPDEIIRALQDRIPAGAAIGEMIVHRSPELTMLYARVPPRMQSAIHNHTVCACIGQLRGEEVNRIYERSEDGGLREVRQMTVRAGEAIALDADIIHCIENPGHETAHALHLYRGDFGALDDKRSLWGWGDHREQPFSFPRLLEESAKAMHQTGNREGLATLREAIPAARPLVDRLTAST